MSTRGAAFAPPKVNAAEETIISMHYLEVKEYSLFCLSKRNFLRRLCLTIIRSPWLDRFLIIAILANCAILAAYDPLDFDNISLRNQISVITEPYFTAIFTIDAIIKIIALDLWGTGLQKGYFNDGWNWLDFFIVLMCYVSLAPNVSNVSALRTLRVLRAFRTLTAAKGMKVIISSILSAIPALGNVGLLLIFTLFLVGMVCLELFSGILRGKCAYQDPYQNNDWIFTDTQCALPCDQYENSNQCTPAYGDTCAETYTLYPVDANGTVTVLQVPQSCRNGPNPDWGMTSFDNIGYAMLTGYVILTTEGWSDTMYRLWHTFGAPVFISLFFVIFILFGSFFLLNLALAAINEEYDRLVEQQRRSEDKLLTLLDSQNIRTGDIVMAPGEGGLADLAMQLTKLQQEAKKEHEREVKHIKELQDEANTEAIRTFADVSTSVGQAIAEGVHGVADVIQHTLHVSHTQDHEETESAKSTTKSQKSSSSITTTTPTTTTNKTDTTLVVTNPMLSSSPEKGSTTPIVIGKTSPRKGSSKSYDDPLKETSYMDIVLNFIGKKLSACYSVIPGLPRTARIPFKKIINHWAFSTFMIAAILANSISLACVYYNMPEKYDIDLALANIVFVIIFAIEMVLKLLALGLKRYVSDTFNIFDGVVVIISIIELILSAVAPDAFGGGISALRTFRMFRVLKLARQWKQLNKLISTVASIIPAVGNASLVLAVVMFIFSLLGMQLFGGIYDAKVADGILDEVPRANFNNLWWAWVTVFWVMTNENWNDVLHQHMAADSIAACIFFVVLVVVGNYIFLNLFLAILLNGFDEAEEAEVEEEQMKEANRVQKKQHRASLHARAAAVRAGDRNAIPLTEEEEDELLFEEESMGPWMKVLKIFKILVRQGRDICVDRCPGECQICNFCQSDFLDASDDELDDEDIEIMNNETLVVNPLSPSHSASKTITSTTNSDNSESLLDNNNKSISTSENTNVGSGKKTKAKWKPTTEWDGQWGVRSDNNAAMQAKLAAKSEEAGPPTTTRSEFIERDGKTAGILVNVPSLPEKSHGLGRKNSRTEDGMPRQLPSLRIQILKTGDVRVVPVAAEKLPSDDPILRAHQLQEQAAATAVPKTIKGKLLRFLSDSFNKVKHIADESPDEVASPSSLSSGEELTFISTFDELRATDRHFSVHKGLSSKTPTSSTPRTTDGNSPYSSGRNLKSDPFSPSVVSPGFKPGKATNLYGIQAPKTVDPLATISDEELLEHVEAAGVDDILNLEKPFTLKQLAKMEDHNSCGFIPHDTLVRKLAASIVVNPWFERLTLLVILISSLNLALDEPKLDTCGKLPAGDPNSCIGLRKYIDMADIIITAYFALELTLKIIAQGFFFHELAYLRNSWNILDFVIVIISIVSLATASNGIKALRAFRALRALRPLRAVSRFPGLKLVVNALLRSLPKVFDVATVVILFIFIFAVIGVQNFRGLLAACNDPDISYAKDCTGDFTLIGDMCAYLPTIQQEDACRNSTGVLFPRIWAPIPRNFDNIGAALLSVFELGTGEDWPSRMTEGVDAANNPGEPMIRDNNPAAALYFILIQFVLGFVLLDFFAGLIVDTYKQLKANAQGTGLLTPAQRIWVDNMLLMLSLHPRPIKAPPALTKKFQQSARHRFVYNLRQFMYKITLNPWFERIIMFCILSNVVFLALKHYGMSDALSDVVEYANYAFTIIFAIEAIIKLLGLGIKQYFQSDWCRFDFALVIASLFSAGFSIAASSSGSKLTGAPIATLLRILRILRLFRLVRVNKGLQRMLRTVIFALPSLSNVAGVLFLIYFIFAIVGMNLFAGVRYGFATTGNLDENANFDSFSIALITLFRCSTGENYNGLMHDLMVQPPYCLVSGVVGDTCGEPISSPIYWVIFFALTDFLMIKLLVAIVLDAFLVNQEAEDRGDATYKLTEPTAKRFRRAWQQFDPSAMKTIGYRNLVQLVQNFDYPLGIANHPRYKPEQREDPIFMSKAAERLVSSLALVPDTNGHFHFSAVLYALCAHASGGSALGAPVGAVAVLGAPTGTHGYTLREIRAAILVQSAFRARQAKKLIAEKKLIRLNTLANFSSSSPLGGDSTPTLSTLTPKGVLNSFRSFTVGNDSPTNQNSTTTTSKSPTGASNPKLHFSKTRIMTKLHALGAIQEKKHEK